MYNSVFLLLCDISRWLVKLKNTHIDFAESFTCEINALRDSSQVALWSFRCEMDHSSICNRPFCEALQSNLRIQGEMEGRPGNPYRGIWANLLRKEPGRCSLPLFFFFFQFFFLRVGRLSINLWPYPLLVCNIWAQGDKLWRCLDRCCHMHLWFLSTCPFSLTVFRLFLKRLFDTDLLHRVSLSPKLFISLYLRGWKFSFGNSIRNLFKKVSDI